MKRLAAATVASATAALGWNVHGEHDPGFRVTNLRSATAALGKVVAHRPRTAPPPATVGGRQRCAFHSVALGPRVQPLLHNSVLLVPTLLSGPEGAVLIEAAEEGLRAGLSTDDDAADPLQRLRVTDLSAPARRVDAALRGRLGIAPSGQH